MANYIGNEPQLINNQRDYFTGTSAQLNFPLSANPGGANGLLVFISGVQQRPSVAYFVSGKTLSFSEAPPAPMDGEVTNIEVVYLQKLGVTRAANWRVPVSSNAGGTDLISASYSPPFATLADNALAFVTTTSANTTTTPTFSPDGLPARLICNQDGSAVDIGTVIGTVLLRYSTSLDKWVYFRTETSVTQPRSDSSTKNATTEFVHNTAGGSVGEIKFFPSTSAPARHLKINGALYSRAAYPELYAFAEASGNIVADGSWQAGNFSYGDGSTTFRVPDGRGEFFRGFDDSRGVDTGRVIGTAQADDFKGHSHNYNGTDLVALQAGGTNVFANYSGATSTTGGAETRPRNVALLACIRY